MAAASVRIFRLTSQYGKQSLLFRLSLRNLSKQSCAPFSTSACSNSVLRKLIPNEGFWTKNERMQRPMSPHIMIYSFPLPAIMSITNRVTGGALSAVIATAGIGALLLPGDSATYISLIKSLDIPIWLLAPAKACLIWPLIYHTINGVRHLVWDFGRGLHMQPIYVSGYLIFGASFIATIGAVAYCSCSC